MPKIRKVKRKKTYKVNINRKRLRNKMRKLPDIKCPQIKAAWENKKSTKMNLLQMGLSYDPNKSLKIPNVKSELVKNAKQMALGEIIKSEKKENKQKRVPKKVQVAMALEEDAKAPRESSFKLPNGQVQFLTYLMDKYGDDYEAMARDKKNYYQLTWRQIKSKINTFKGIPIQYAEYLLKKGEIILENPEPLKETMKRIAEENVKKYCAPKKPKKQKKSISQWMEELIEDEKEDSDVPDVLETLEDEGSEEKSSKTEKKLQLFSDDESDDQQKTKINNESVKKNKTQQNQSKKLKKNQRLDEESDLDDDDDDDSLEFKDLDDMNDQDVSDDDILDDDEFLTDSD